MSAADRDDRIVPDPERGRSFRAPDGTWRWTCIRCAAQSGERSWPTLAEANDAAWAHDAQCPTR